MGDFDIHVVGVVRDVTKQRLAKSYRQIQRAFSSHGKVKWTIVESNSTNRTVHYLNALSGKKGNIRVKSLGVDLEGSRIQKIARARNFALALLRETVGQDISMRSVLVVADLDGINNRLRVPRDLLERSVSLRAAFFPVQTGPYYDISALRHKLWAPNDPWKQFSDLESVLGADAAHQIAISARQVVVPRDASTFEVESAFGGIAVYPLNEIISSSMLYETLDSQGNEECEHVSFNRQLANLGVRLIVDPRFTNAKYTEHTLRKAPILGAYLRFRTWVRKSLPPAIASKLSGLFK